MIRIKEVARFWVCSNKHTKYVQQTKFSVILEAKALCRLLTVPIFFNPPQNLEKIASEHCEIEQKHSTYHLPFCIVYFSNSQKYLEIMLDVR